MGYINDLTGQKFGRLTVVEFSHNKGNSYWKCVCECGEIRIVRGSHLTNSKINSCGCLAKEIASKLSKQLHIINTKHNASKSSEFKIWWSMCQRCYNCNANSYRNYGGRGIVVCDRWRNSFENFLADMGKRPSAKHSLDRIDNNGNYESGNCRWATANEQANNTRRNRLITIDGETKTLTQWCRQYHIHVNTFSKRIKNGWLTLDALTIPVNKKFCSYG